MRWCGPEVEVEGIVSLKTGGCPEDCHFCSQSGQFPSPGALGVAGHPRPGQGGPRDRRDRRERVLHRRRRARPGQAAAVPGPRRHQGDPRRTATTSRSPARSACSPRRRSTSSSRWACTATTTTSRPPARTSRTSSPRTRGRSAGTRCGWCTRQAWRCAAAASSAWGRPSSSAPSSPSQLAELDPHEVPMNFLIPQPGTPYENYEMVEGKDALRTVAAFRLALPRTILRFAGGRELTLGDLGRRAGHARRHQRDHRRQLPDQPRPSRPAGPRHARRS